tara:strand:+ start:346 stop:546 length:201 start_codon:yes stop_codon:yes gene_type:complete
VLDALVNCQKSAYSKRRFFIAKNTYISSIKVPAIAIPEIPNQMTKYPMISRAESSATSAKGNTQSG